MVEPHLDCVALGRLGDVRLLLSGEGVVALVLEGAVVVVKDCRFCLLMLRWRRFSSSLF